MAEEVVDSVEACQQASPGRRRRTPSAAVERELIGAAKLVLARDGVAGLTVRAVAEEARTSQTTVYNRFGGKDGLVNALLVRGLEELRVLFEGCEDPSGVERLISIGLRYREWGLANPHMYALLFENATAHQASAEVYQKAELTFRFRVRAAELAAAELAAAGRPFVGLTPYQVAQRTWWTMHGAVSLELNKMVRVPDPAVSYRELLEAIIRGLSSS
jgi:AcrR family transcriptional regulator